MALSDYLGEFETQQNDVEYTQKSTGESYQNHIDGVYRQDDNRATLHFGDDGNLRCVNSHNDQNDLTYRQEYDSDGNPL